MPTTRLSLFYDLAAFPGYGLALKIRASAASMSEELVAGLTYPRKILGPLT